jgi:hypothetical protein
LSSRAEAESRILSRAQVSDFVTIITSKRRGTGQRGSISPLSVSGSREYSDSPPAFAGNGHVDSCASPVTTSNTSSYTNFGRLYSMPSRSSSAAGSDAGQNSLIMDIPHCDSHEITCLSPKSKTTLLRTPEAIEAMLYNSGRYVGCRALPRRVT